MWLCSGVLFTRLHSPLSCEGGGTERVRPARAWQGSALVRSQPAHRAGSCGLRSATRPGLPDRRAQGLAGAAGEGSAAA